MYVNKPLIAFEEEFFRLVPREARVERVAAGFGFTEGPVWRGDHLLFTDIDHSRIVRWRERPEGPEVSTFRVEREGMTDPPGIGHCNGMTLDAQNRLIVCGQGARHVTRTEPDGSITVLADRFEGRRLNSPNDVVVHDSGAIYFTDPPHGLRGLTMDKELPFQGVYRIETSGALHLEVDDFEHPNGLAFSPDQRTLYVDDDARGHVRAFEVRPDGSLANERLFAETPLGGERGHGVPDGMKIDREGHLFLTSVGGIWIFAPDGRPIGIIGTPEIPANLAWGDGDLRTLYITARSSLYRIRLGVSGIAVGSARQRS